MPPAIPFIIAAAPLFAGAASYGAGFTIGTLSVATTASLVSAGVAVAASGAGLLLAPKPDRPDITARGATKVDIGPRRLIYGRAMTGGQLIYEHGSNNGRLLRIQVLSGHEVDAIEEVWIDDEIATIVAGVITNGRYDGKVSAWTELGTAAQTANADFLAVVAATSQNPEWTTDHRLRGCAYLATKASDGSATDHAKIYRTGRPNFRAVIRGAKVYDSREGGHDPDDSSTWTWSENPVLCAQDYLTYVETFPGLTEPLRRGFGVPLASLDLSAWEDAADACEESITINAGGSEDRYRCGGVLDLAADPVDNLRTIMSVCGGEIYQTVSGTYGVRVGLPTPAAPDAAFTKRSIKALRLRKWPEIAEAVTEVQASFTRPAEQYASVQSPAFRDDDVAARIGGDRKTQLDLRFCPSGYQAQRITKAALVKAQRKWAGEIVTDATGLNALGTNRIYLTHATYGFDAAVFERGPALVDLGGALTCKFDIWQYPEDPWAWDPATEEQVLSAVSDPGSYDELDSPVNLAATPVDVVIDARTNAAGLEITWDDPVDDALSVEVQYRIHDAGETSETGWQQGGQTRSDLSITIAPLEDGASIDVRARFRTTVGNSPWTDVIEEVVVTADTTGPDEAVDEAAETTVAFAQNLLTYSEQFDNAAWTKSLTATANKALAPDGTLTADMLVDNSAAAIQAASQGVTIASGTAPYVGSVYIRKADTATAFVGVRLTWSVGTTKTATINVNQTTGEFLTAGSASNIVGTVEDVGNYWRASIKGEDSGGNTTLTLYVYPAYSTTLNTADVAAQGTVYGWGAQLHAGSTPQDYVKTTTTAVTVDSSDVTYSWTNSNSANLFGTRIYRDTSGSFATETDVSGLIRGGPNQMQTYTDTPGSAGTFYYRSRAENGSGVQSSPTTGVSVTTTA